MELETKHTIQSMIKELYAWCHMSRPACVNDHHHKMGVGGKINIQIRFLFFKDRKCAEKWKKFLIAFYGHRCP
jgi:hypothetical protein